MHLTRNDRLTSALALLREAAADMEPLRGDDRRAAEPAIEAIREAVRLVELAKRDQP